MVVCVVAVVCIVANSLCGYFTWNQFVFEVFVVCCYEVVFALTRIVTLVYLVRLCLLPYCTWCCYYAREKMKTDFSEFRCFLGIF